MNFRKSQKVSNVAYIIGTIAAVIALLVGGENPTVRYIMLGIAALGWIVGFWVYYKNCRCPYCGRVQPKDRHVDCMYCGKPLDGSRAERKKKKKRN